MTVEIRRFESGFEDVERILCLAFGETPDPAAFDAEHALYEPARSLGAYEGGLVVGHTAAYTMRMRVPGAIADVAGVSLVGVLPTHRRRGILRGLMTRQLHEIHESGAEPIAGLTASEPAIYGRFGYGLASEVASVEIAHASAWMRQVSGVDEIAIRYADAEQELATIGSLHAASMANRPGSVVHTDVWLRKQIADPPSERDGGSALRCVLAERDGTPVGYALYRTHSQWTPAGAGGRVHIPYLKGVDLPAHVALWRFLLDQDLMATTTSRHLALDDPLLSLLLDIRQAGIRVRDGLWVRLIDVDRALAARTYRAEVDLVLEVNDQFCPWNSGRWRLGGGPTGGTCARTTDPVDLEIDIRDLGAAFMGRPVLGALGRAGLVVERKAGALDMADRAFSSAPLPFLDTPF